MELLKEKIKMVILEPSCTPYSNRWFTMPKKNGALCFIQDMQPMNKVTIKNVRIGPIVDEFAEAFVGKSIYSMGDLYLGYDQFQLDTQFGSGKDGHLTTGSYQLSGTYDEWYE